MDTLGNSLQMITNGAILQFLLKGLAFTLVISVIAVLFGLMLGSVLALLRNYANNGFMKILKFLSIAYIEVFRNTPLLLWIFISTLMPLPKFLSTAMFGLSSVEVGLMFKAAGALILFTSSVVAEIVRGGLNAVPEGQFEAGFSQGFNTVQVMIYIVLPQAYRKIIPTLLSQVITTIKDSSYLANVAIIELMSRTRQLLSAANQYNGTNTINVSDVFVLFGFAAVIYFIINFALSSVVRYMQKNPRAKKQMAQEA